MQCSHIIRGHPWHKNTVLILLLSLLHVLVAPADPVLEGTVTGEVAGGTAITRDSGDSTGVRRAPKRKSLDPNPEQGIYTVTTVND